MSEKKHYKGKRRQFQRKVMLLLVLLSVMAFLIVLLFFYLKRVGAMPQIDETGFFSAWQNDKEENMDKEVYPLFVGDSRTVGMKEAVPDIDALAEIGSTIYYLYELENRILETGDDCVVIGFGVNDLTDIDEYIAYANYLGEDLGIPVFFTTVNPVDESKARGNGYHMTNSRIESFNAKLIENANSYIVINSYDYLMSEGYNTVDGLHYDEATYIKIHDFLMDEIKEWM